MTRPQQRRVLLTIGYVLLAAYAMISIFTWITLTAIKVIYAVLAGLAVWRVYVMWSRA